MKAAGSGAGGGELQGVLIAIGFDEDMLKPNQKNNAPHDPFFTSLDVPRPIIIPKSLDFESERLCKIDSTKKQDKTLPWHRLSWLQHPSMGLSLGGRAVKSRFL